MDIEWFVVLSALIFAIGAAGVLTRRSPLVILLCLELMLNAGNLALVAFSRMVGNGDGQVFALIVMVVAACEVVIGLGIIVAMYRRRLKIDVDARRGAARMSPTDYGWLVLLFPLLGTVLIIARLAALARPRWRAGSPAPRSGCRSPSSIGMLCTLQRQARGGQVADRHRVRVRRAPPASTRTCRSWSTRCRSSCAWWSPASRP